MNTVNFKKWNKCFVKNIMFLFAKPQNIFKWVVISNVSLFIWISHSEKKRHDIVYKIPFLVSAEDVEIAQPYRNWTLTLLGLKHLRTFRQHNNHNT